MQVFIVIALVLALATSTGSRGRNQPMVEARPAAVQGQQQQQQQADATSAPTSSSIFTTVNGPASSQLDDPLGVSDGATTSSGDDSASSSSSNAGMDDICVRCYDKVKFAQDQVSSYEGLLRKQKKLISRLKAAVEAVEAVDAIDAVQSSSSSRRKSPRSLDTAGSRNPQHQQQQQQQANSTIRSRTLLDGIQAPIVVSRLRVARSPATAVEQSPARQQQQPPRSSPFNGNKNNLNKKDLGLAQLRREIQRQNEATCKSLLEVRDCLDQLSRECIGNLQFHSYEVFSDQYHGKFRCPYPNHPNIKPILGRHSMDLDDDDAETKVPIVRPISSPETVRERLDKILPGRQFPSRPMNAVMLKPTLVAPSTSRHFFQPSIGGGPAPAPAMADASRRLQLEQFHQLKPLGSNGHAGFKHDDHFTHTSASQQQQQQQQLDLAGVGKLLLVPCCFAILMVALLALATTLRFGVGIREDSGAQVENDKTAAAAGARSSVEERDELASIFKY